LADAVVAHVLARKDLQWFRQSSSSSSSSSSNENGDDSSKNGRNNNASTTNGTKEEEETTTKQQECSHDPVVLVSTIVHDDVPAMAKTLTATVANLVRSTSAVLLSSINMLLISPRLLGVAVSIVPLVGAGAMVLRKSIRTMGEADHDLVDTTASFLQERLRHIDLVRQCDRSNDEIATYRHYQAQRLQLAERTSLRQGCMMGFLFTATASALTLVVYMGGKAVGRGKITGGQLTSFSTYAFLLGIGTSGLVKGYSEGAAGLVAAERYYKLLAYDDDDDIANGECTTKVDDAAAAVRGQELEKPQNVQSLNVQDLHFYYKDSPHRPCLNGVSFELRRGEVVALVGANGSGKTTMASLLCGLFTPTKGAIYVCDPTTGAQTALSDLNRSSKQRLVQMIPQSAALFDISIVENVRYGNPTASLLDVRYALSKAKCNDFISRLPNGLDSRIGVGGRSLSGGECQRLALARALLADPPILIMDEPTNSLDAEGMAAISEAVSSGQGRAMLLITHHSKTLELADRVLVMDHGTIVEQGTLSKLRGNRNSKLCELMPSLVKVQ
jgi:ATP-binding cassette, subfamily B, bacterial